jgi:asparagine synthase (glutamine-hydrolysing)
MNGERILKRLDNFLHYEPGTRAEQYCRWLLFFDKDQKERLYTDTFSREVLATTTESLIGDWMEASGKADLNEAALFADIHTYLPDDLLVKMDRATMAHSLEARSPFLDHELMEFAASLPLGLKLKGLTRKWILKRSVARLLPRTVIHRPKRGFGLPVGEWLRHELKEMLLDTLASRRALQRGYFNRHYIEEIVGQHMSRRCNWQYHLWNLLILELWHRIFIDQPYSSTGG